jgi:hypothetical protein
MSTIPPEPSPPAGDAAAGTPTPTTQAAIAVKDRQPPPPKALADRLKVIGGLIALGIGLLALLLVVVFTLAFNRGTGGESVATAAIGVIGSTVGAYFGVKIGTDGTSRSIDAQQDEALKAQVIALHIPEAKAGDVVTQMSELLQEQRDARRADR